MRWCSIALTLSLFGVAVSWEARTSASQTPNRQTSPQQEDVLPALLVEVRGLRAAMEEMASAGPRVQLALGRVQLQEQRVNTLMRRLEEGRAHVAEMQRNYERTQQQLAAAEDMLRTPKPDSPPVAALQSMQRDAERELTRITTDLQRMTAELAAMEADLAAEQGRWIDLNQRMEALEQSLVRR